VQGAKLDKNFSPNPAGLATISLAGLKVAVIGGTGGIGRAISRQLAAKGADVVVVGQTFRDQNAPRIAFMRADLSLLQEARRVADQLQARVLDIVIFTTGIMAGPTREVTAEGLERDLAVSYLSRFVILNGIAPHLGKDRTKSETRPRVFVMGFPGTEQKADVDDLNSERSYKRMAAHANTVAGNEVLVLEAGRRFPDIDVFGLNPGMVKTSIRENFFGSRLSLAVVEWLTGFMMIEPDVYAGRMVPLLVSRDLNGRSGAMFNAKAQAILPSPSAQTASYATALTTASEALIARAGRAG
jgi:NAD(P)-dependent dehydrogenase (short-subunit alcohol dehydrogenase family)